MENLAVKFDAIESRKDAFASSATQPSYKAKRSLRMEPEAARS